MFQWEAKKLCRRGAAGGCVKARPRRGPHRRLCPLRQYGGMRPSPRNMHSASPGRKRKAAGQAGPHRPKRAPCSRPWAGARQRGGAFPISCFILLKGHTAARQNAPHKPHGRAEGRPRPVSPHAALAAHGGAGVHRRREAQARSIRRM
uniref:Uncharacterized protein n=1 Tax=Myoviridae sp. ctTOm1 TaxID=2826657 RepID=A0A8S5N483_9CAUD|nr:MAG TPA: hypothetical protein [Myoviridae sp. ctTOm1]